MTNIKVGKKVLTLLVTLFLFSTLIIPFVSDSARGDTSTDWPANRHDLQATSGTSVEPVSKHDIIWGHEFVWYLMFEDALVKDNEVYTRDFGRTVYSLNLTTGASRWTYSTNILQHMEGFHDYLVGDQCLYLFLNQTDLLENFTNSIVALHRTDGSECFKITFKTNEWIGGPILNDRGLILANNTTLRIYDQHTGALLDTQPVGTKIKEFYQASDKDTVYFEDKDHIFHAYDLNKKADAWTSSIEPAYGWFYPVIVAGNRLFMTTNWRNVTAFDKTNGNILWSVEQVDALEMAANDKYLITDTYEDLTAYDISTGTMQWRHDFQNTNFSMDSPPTIAGDQVLVSVSECKNCNATTEGFTNLTSYNIQNGDKLWSYSSTNTSMIFEPPVVVPNIIIFISGSRIYALGDRSKFAQSHQSLAKDAKVFFNGNITTTTNKKVDFKAPAVSGIDLGTASYEWNFGDGTKSTEKEPSHAYTRSGSYVANLTLKQGGRIVVVQNGVKVRPVTVLRSPVPVLTVTISIVLIVVVIGLVGASRTEPGMYWMLPFFVVLYSRIKNVEALDHYTRGRIMGYLQANPGEHYNSIREELKIQNGVLAYHLKVLEREGYIRSRRDRILKRFYPADAKVPQPISVEEQIIGAIRRNPGITQIEIADKTGLAPSTINRVLHQQEQAGAVVLVRDGRHVRCHLLKEPAQ